MSRYDAAYLNGVGFGLMAGALFTMEGIGHLSVIVFGFLLITIAFAIEVLYD